MPVDLRQLFSHESISFFGMVFFHVHCTQHKPLYWKYTGHFTFSCCALAFQLLGRSVWLVCWGHWSQGALRVKFCFFPARDLRWHTASGLVPKSARNSYLRETDTHHFCLFSHINSELFHTGLWAAHISLPLAFPTLQRSFACTGTAGCWMPALQASIQDSVCL